MGSLEVGGGQLKRAPLLRSSSSSGESRYPFLQRPRSRFARFLLFEKVDYLQWIFTIAVFFFVVILFQAFLPGSMMEGQQESTVVDESGSVFRDLVRLKEMGRLEFGEGIRFEPEKLLEKFKKEGRGVSLSSGARFGVRKPELALVFADLSVEPVQLKMITIAVALQAVGYNIQVYCLGDGPVHALWRRIRVPVTVLQNSDKQFVAVDWLNYDGILVNALETRGVISCLVQEPFKYLPVIWTISERTLAVDIEQYSSNEKLQLIDEWKQAFNRATVVVFPDAVLPMMYSLLDAGNYFVIPGSPEHTWEADNFLSLYSKDDTRFKMGYGADDFVIAIVGSEFSYSGSWLEHALVFQAILPLFSDFQAAYGSSSHLKVAILSENLTSNYSVAVEAIALNIGYPKGSMKNIGINEDVNSFLSTSDLVVYGSFLEEQFFPSSLVKAMSFEKPIVAPDLAIIKKYVDDGVNGYLFPKESTGLLTQILSEIISNGKLSHEAQAIASKGKSSARNLMVLGAVEGYASLLENVLKFPSEVAYPKAATEISSKFKEKWMWQLFNESTDTKYLNRPFTNYSLIDKIKEPCNHTRIQSFGAGSGETESFSYSDWAEEKSLNSKEARKRREEEELKDRTDLPRGKWEELYRNAKRVERTKNVLHERDDRELERTGQPLCIYEPFFGEGTWPFLHSSSLYRGIGLTTKGRRPGADDIDGPSRLPLLSNGYYRNVLGNHGAFFAIANQIDHIHKNAWIGFHSWRATARKASLSKIAESSVIKAIEAQRHGDALYFWVRMNDDPRNPSKQDFWTFCDAINAGNCRSAVSGTLRRMYGIKENSDPLPPMPVDGNTWSVMHSWALPTKSFLEFVMFSRMFVNALDEQMYDEHHQNGSCPLSLLKDHHCYSRVLELLVNIWAYHSARRMVYVNHETGVMQEQHKLHDRRGQMWVKWFSYTTLKSMDEDLAEELDSEKPTRRWLWPSTGEVFWRGVYERERNSLLQQKKKRKQNSKDKIERMRKRGHQRTLGKYLKPPPEDTGNSNSTTHQVKMLL